MEDDDTDVLSCTTSELADEERQVAKAVGKSLEEEDDDPAVAEAKKRLLASDLLRSEGDFDPDESTEGGGRSGANSQSISPVVSQEGDVERGANGSGSPRNWSGYSIGGAGSDANPVPTERTGLLMSPANGTSFMEALRPSIFTTVASIAEIDSHRVDEGQGDNETGDETGGDVKDQDESQQAEPSL